MFNEYPVEECGAVIAHGLTWLRLTPEEEQSFVGLHIFKTILRMVEIHGWEVIEPKIKDALEQNRLHYKDKVLNQILDRVMKERGIV